MRLTDEQLATARAAALDALGKSGDRTLAKLDDAGLVVVRLADVAPEPHTYTEEDVVLRVAEPWAEPWKVIVEKGNHSIILNAAPDAVPGIREAIMLREVMRSRVHVEIDEAAGLVLRAWTEDR